jgi:anti-sigma factor RsiW
MQCSDLERYLEAYLDLRLGRSRGAILRRHLSACPHCRARVEHLREFERGLQRSFRAMERAQSVWTGLEPDLVRSGGLAESPPVLPFLTPVDAPRSVSALVDAMSRRPVRPPTRPDVSAARARARRAKIKWWSHRAIGVALLAAASLGITMPMWRTWQGGDAADAQMRAYAEWRGGDSTVQFATTSADGLRSWLVPQLGESLPELPAPSGFALVGGSVDERVSPALAFVVYHHGDDTTLLLVTPQAADSPASTEPVASSHNGLSQLRWSQSGYAYSVVSPLSESELLPFSLATAEPL